MSILGSPRLGSLSVLYFQCGRLHQGKSIAVRTFQKQKKIRGHSYILMKLNIHLSCLESPKENKSPILQVIRDSGDTELAQGQPFAVQMAASLTFQRCPGILFRPPMRLSLILFLNALEGPVLDIKGGCQTLTESGPRGSCALKSPAELVTFPDGGGACIH